MFSKPYKLKNNVPLKGSEIKKLRQRLQEAFSDIDLGQLISSKASVSLLKLITHGESQTSVYCVDKLPIFFEIEGGRLVPTVYALWQVNNLLPFFTTHPEVLPRLKNGADLMLPGVIAMGVGMNVYGHYKQGQLVAVNLTSNKAAIGVGILPKSSEDLYMSGGYGVGVKILHVFGDKLWSHEHTLVQQVPSIQSSRLTEEDFPPLGPKKHNTDIKPAMLLEEQSNPIGQQEDESLHDTKNGQSVDEVSEAISNTLSQNLAFDKVEYVETELTPEAILKESFLAALKNNTKSLQLPLLTSNFYRLYMVPEAKEALDIKKTKYKKLSNFLNEMIEEGFIVVREETKGVNKITSINFDHPELVNFITDIKKSNVLVEGTNGENQNPLFKSELTELYVITDVTAPLFTKLNYKRGEAIPAVQIKKILREYVNKQNLSIANECVTDKSYVLDEILQKICQRSAAPLNCIVSSIIAKMEQRYEMCSVKDVASNKPLIQMSLATRSWNKKVTLVSNIECYGIIMQEFIKLCKQGAAASTTVVTLPNQKREMLQIQGNQVRFIYNLLTQTYQIPPKCILGLELAKDGKKHQKK
uniref:SUI1 domain-containing protein n=1 Tax=Glossina brevipalpis TaxID=37001 RepID=A0A1A9W606_9MUSC